MTKYVKLFENFDGDEDQDIAALRGLGLAKAWTTWNVELEIEFDYAVQTTPEEVKSVFVGWIPEINQIDPDFEVLADSVEIDEWTEEDYMSRPDGLPEGDEVDTMRKPDLLDLIDSYGLELDEDDPTRLKLADLRDAIKMAIEETGFGDINYDQRNFLRFTMKTISNDEAEVSAWIEENVIGSGRVVNSIETLERMA